MAGQRGEPADSHSRLLFDVFSACLLLLTALLGKLLQDQRRTPCSCSLWPLARSSSCTATACRDTANNRRGSCTCRAVAPWTLLCRACNRQGLQPESNWLCLAGAAVHKSQCLEANVQLCFCLFWPAVACRSPPTQVHLQLYRSNCLCCLPAHPASAWRRYNLPRP
jgi:hypothetical protein